MKKTVCRAFTFINYHIPLRWDNNISVQYSTIGFFDGLFTKRISINYKEDDLKPLWQYTSSLTAKNEGYYSYQNVFGFSRDEWNNNSDDMFWKEGTDEEYPLTFVVFLQIKDYMVGEHTIESQCKEFANVVDSELREIGKSYVYSTIDKNDFIVCIKSKYYEKTVAAIKKLHDASVKVVYSYTIFSIHRDILGKLEEKKYEYLFGQYIPSICLKGIANSYEAGTRVALDRKYRQFCNILIQRLYQKDNLDEKDDHDSQNILYDILGDNDFRLIARNVSLGRILREYAPGGILSYTEKVFPYYLFSSSLVLNTLTGKKEGIKDTEIDTAIEIMQNEFTCKMCDNLSRQMDDIVSIVKSAELSQKDRVVTFCQAIFQLLQSLKVLEEAPTKKYDFYSLYLPFETLVHILESKVNDPNIGNNNMIYEFIHKISMTLHGTLRTDIQFFQIRDFNVIVHYAPAKIRAFYTLWAMKIRDYYMKFVFDIKESSHEYSFILAPGMYKGTAVRQLFESDDEDKHLMLITLPERHLYSPRWITIVLAHEVSHFVGSELRNREERHKTWLKVLARILELELYALFYRELLCLSSDAVLGAYEKNPDMLDQIKVCLMKAEEKIRKEKKEKRDHIFHSKNSIGIIMESYRMFLKHYVHRILVDFSCNVRYFVSDSSKKYAVEASDDDIRKICNEVTKDMTNLCDSLGKVVFEDMLKLIKTLTAETFADIMAILTLELSPIEYVRSFVKTELGENEGGIGENKTVTFIDVRIAAVVQTISKVFKENPTIKCILKNYGEWSSDPVAGMIKENDYEDERRIVEAVQLFLKEKCVWPPRIDRYMSLYDPASHSFVGGNCGFLRDEQIFDLICDYLGGCTELYIKKIADSKDVANERDGILETYRNISKETEIEVMEEIEGFLSNAENLYEKKTPNNR